MVILDQPLNGGLRSGKKYTEASIDLRLSTFLAAKILCHCPISDLRSLFQHGLPETRRSPNWPLSNR